MGESTKVILSLILGIAGVVGAIAWIPGPTDPLTWPLRIGGPVVALLALGMIIKLQFRSDLAFDYLRKHQGDYQNHHDFCFTCESTAVDGIAYVEVGFQNQRDEQCLGHLQLRHFPERWQDVPTLDVIEFEIDCAPAAYGLATCAVAVPKKLQGKYQRFRIRASAEFPNGTGRKLRFYDGIFARVPTWMLEFPVDVADDLPDSAQPEIQTLWKLGDSPLESVPS